MNEVKVSNATVGCNMQNMWYIFDPNELEHDKVRLRSTTSNRSAPNRGVGSVTNATAATWHAWTP
eukprot:4494259-Amphidinium_carterae.1